MAEDKERASKEMFDAFKKLLHKKQRVMEYYSQNNSQTQNRYYTNNRYVGSSVPEIW